MRAGDENLIYNEQWPNVQYPCSYEIHKSMTGNSAAAVQTCGYIGGASGGTNAHDGNSHFSLFMFMFILNSWLVSRICLMSEIGYCGDRGGSPRIL